MENKKTIIGIIVISILIIGLLAMVIFYNNFEKQQLNALTEEANKILEANLIEDSIDLDIKTEKNYAKLEKSIKDYISKMRNIYVEMEEMVSGINPNVIFSAQNIQDKNLEEIDNIIKEYKEKSQNFISEYEQLITKEKIAENINNVDISTRKEYYINLYNEIMLSEMMQNQYEELDDEIKNEKARLYEKLNKIEKIKEFLEENEKSWEIKNDKIQFLNLNRMTEYYNLLNQVID